MWPLSSRGNGNGNGKQLELNACMGGGGGGGPWGPGQKKNHLFCGFPIYNNTYIALELVVEPAAEAVEIPNGPIHNIAPGIYYIYNNI